jgi:hypothetical protein
MIPNLFFAALEVDADDRHEKRRKDRHNYRRRGFDLLFP